MCSKKKVFLTIDDSPSDYFSEKIDFLYSHDIPAVIFCIGQEIEKQPQAVIDAIQKGFVIGNHSYSHPHFSKISLSEAKSEIYKTDQIISDLYERAKVPRPANLFRFPYGDKGWDRKPHRLLKVIPAWLYFKLNRKLEIRHRENIQAYLKKLSYSHPKFENINYSFYHKLGLSKACDIYWTFDFLEYGAENLEEVLTLITQPNIWDIINSRRCKVGSLIDHSSDDIALIHDHNETTDWFYEIIAKCKKMDINFGSLF